VNDQEFAGWLKKRLRAKEAIRIVRANWACKVAVVAEDEPALIEADPEKRSLTQLKKLAKAGLLQQAEVDHQVLEKSTEFDTSWETKDFDEADVNSFIQRRLKTLGKSGRGKVISQNTAWKVWADAGGCCMYEGCAKDLSKVHLHTKAAKISYLAHVVASSANGPRGDEIRSELLSDDPENIMLMCDEHHRLIDSFASQAHPEERLLEMRRNHVEKMKTLRKAMAYPTAQVVTLFADLGGVPTRFRETDYQEALLKEKLAMAPRVEYLIRRKDQRDDRSGSSFWSCYLHEHENDIRQLVRFVKDMHKEEHTLAIFPLHHIPTLVLAGRIIGEASPVEVFQYDRHCDTWCWHHDVPAHPQGTFSINGMTQESAEEVLLTIELTASINENSLPETLREEIRAKKMPWIRIQTENPHQNIIRRAEDLQQFRFECRRAINHIQDELRAEKIHLIVVSPASTAFVMGQMLQAGNHPPYVVYDRANQQTAFSQALIIDGQNVSSAEESTSRYVVNIR